MYIFQTHRLERSICSRVRLPKLVVSQVLVGIWDTTTTKPTSSFDHRGPIVSESRLHFSINHAQCWESSVHEYHLHLDIIGHHFTPSQKFSKRSHLSKPRMWQMEILLGLLPSHYIHWHWQIWSSTDIKLSTSSCIYSYVARHGRPPLSTKQLLNSANFTLSILPSRLAHRVQSLRNLPYIVVANPHVSKIHNNYVHSLSTLLPYAEKRIESLEDEIHFTEVMADLVQTHANTISILARGFLEARKYISPQEVTSFLAVSYTHLTLPTKRIV